MYESDIERAHTKKHKDKGGKVYKFKTTKIGAPDRLFLSYIPQRYRLLISKYVRFVEFKAPKKKPSHHQKIFHEELQRLGFRVDLIDRLP